MAFRPLPPADQLRQFVRYNPESGEFRWLARGPEHFEHLRPERRAAAAQTFNGKFADGVAGSSNHNGYLVIKVCGGNFFAHRLAWRIHYGIEPAGLIDHIDGDPKNNRIANLRDCDQAVNQRNRAYRPRAKSGVVGVYWYPPTGKWMARLYLKDSAPFFGYYDTIEEAAEVINAARERMGFADRR